MEEIIVSSFTAIYYIYLAFSILWKMPLKQVYMNFFILGLSVKDACFVKVAFNI